MPPADGAAAGLRGRSSSELRAMASEGPREPVGEVRTARRASGGRASGRARAGDSAGRRAAAVSRGGPGARECGPARVAALAPGSSRKRWLERGRPLGLLGRTARWSPGGRRDRRSDGLEGAEVRLAGRPRPREEPLLRSHPRAW